MDKPPYEVERKLSEYLFRNLNDLQQRIDHLLEWAERQFKDLTSRIIVLETKAYGGMRKTTLQNIGNLSATFVPITNYQTYSYSIDVGIVDTLATGQMYIEKVGNYNIGINLECSFTSDNNSNRNFRVRLYNVTDAVSAAQDISVYAGAYVGGAIISALIPFNVTNPNKYWRLEVGGGSTFAAFNINSAGLYANQL
jgi:hypothetical protein